MTTAASVGCGRYWSRPGHEDEHHRDHGGADDAGELGLRARPLSDRGARSARADREPREQAGRDVGRADADHLLVRVDLLPGPRGERGRGGDRVGERDHGDPEGAREQQRQVGQGDPRDGERGQAAGQDADEATRPGREVEDDREHHRGHDGDQHAGTVGRKRPRTSITAMLNSPMATAAGTASPAATPCTNAAVSPMSPSASVEKPNSLGSWPTRIVRARPFM